MEQTKIGNGMDHCAPMNFRYGSSPANQRIEAMWSHTKKLFTAWVIDFFKNLVDDGILVTVSDIHKELVWFSFAGYLQTELNEVIHEWNSHYIRRSRHHTVPGSIHTTFFYKQPSSKNLRAKWP